MVAGVAEDAFAKGLGSIRAAVHAAGGGTPGWELDVLNGRIQREDVPAGTSGTTLRGRL